MKNERPTKYYDFDDYWRKNRTANRFMVLCQETGYQVLHDVEAKNGREMQEKAKKIVEILDLEGTFTIYKERKTEWGLYYPLVNLDFKRSKK